MQLKWNLSYTQQFPTICTTGEDDYFNGSYGYNDRKGDDGYELFTPFSGPYTGFHYFRNLEKRPQYR
ncbi:MAG: DUF2961 domain-containing protein, partial [Bacteroidetes bacterium]|nr:DUF2961 domain-containing protein [Bacteroidota bacterium]